MHNRTLDVGHDQFKALLDDSRDLILDLFANLDERKAFHAYTPSEVAQWFDEALPQEGMDYKALLEETRRKVLHVATGNAGPHMYAYVMAGGTQMSIVAEQLSAAIDQNVAKWHLSPPMAEIEKRVVQWAGQMTTFAPTCGGVMVSGGSAANLTGLTVARNIHLARSGVREKGLFGLPPLVVYASAEVHNCIDKSLNVLGIGTNQLRKIVTTADFRIDLNALKDAIEGDRTAGLQPFCIVGNAGTVNTGAFDDLNALADIAETYDMWFHVDGAYGGLAATLPHLQAAFSGIERADSLAIDFHKWLYQPFEAGCLLVKDWDRLHQTYFKAADYLDTRFEQGDRLDFNAHYFQLSRNAKAFKVWMSLKAYGFRAIRAMIQKDIDLARYLADEVERSEDFELKARSDLGITCFRYKGDLESEEAIMAINQQLIPALEQDGRVFITGTKLHGDFVLRACLINHRKQEHTIDYLLHVIRDVAQPLHP